MDTEELVAGRKAWQRLAFDYEEEERRKRREAEPFKVERD